MRIKVGQDWGNKRVKHLIETNNNSIQRISLYRKRLLKPRWWMVRSIRYLSSSLIWIIIDQYNISWVKRKLSFPQLSVTSMKVSCVTDMTESVVDMTDHEWCDRLLTDITAELWDLYICIWYPALVSNLMILINIFRK